MGKELWRTLDGVHIQDIQEWIERACTEGQEVHIGTDSLQVGRWTQFVTVAVIHTPGKGGRVAYAKDTVPRITSLRERLLKEVWKSVELAMALGELPLTVHVDANPDERHASSKYLQELVGLVMAQGFRTLIKPESWAASHTADHIVRTLHDKRRGRVGKR